MNWTHDQALEYAKRRLKSEARAREQIILSAKRKAQLPTVTPRSRGPAVAGENPAALAKSRNGYSLPVVLAWFKECGLPEPVPEYRFDPYRKWRFDFAWIMGTGLKTMVALEVQGGLFSGGAHVRGAALLREYAKYNRACCLGWRVLFTTPDQLCMKETADMIHEALAI